MNTLRRSDSTHLLVLCLLLILASCSTKKDAFLNRKWHGLNTKFNTLYNGSLALEKGRNNLIDSYRDNYWEILPVERLQVREDIRLDGVDLNPDFERAEEKAVKAVQKHGMYIRGEEKNRQIDEAYMLLGKSRYYDQRFVPALEAFNFVLQKYPDSDLINEARIWREKTYMRLDNPELALKHLKSLVALADLSREERASAHAAMAQAYIDLKVADTALIALEKAIRETSDKEELARYLFISGQLHNRLNQPDSANIAFGRIIDLNRRVPRVYWMNAQTEFLANLILQYPDDPELQEKMERLAKNPENRDYLGRLNRLQATYWKDKDSVVKARTLYNESLRARDADTTLKCLNYRDLAAMDMEERNFVRAGAYYDSTLTHLSVKTASYRMIKRRREALEDLISNEGIRRRNDSILTLLAMSPDQQREYFQKYIDSLAEVTARAEELLKTEAARRANPGSAPRDLASGNGSFYFYNAQAVARGKEVFRQIWGDVELVDNWKFGGSSAPGMTTPIATETPVAASEGMTTEQFLKSLPKDPETIDSLQQSRDQAYLRLAQLYEERFGEGEYAATLLTKLLSFYPDPDIEAPALFRLTQWYEDKEPATYQRLKSDLLSRYGDTRYATLLNNPASVSQSESKSSYERLLARFEDRDFESVIQGCEMALESGVTREEAARLELLKSQAIARLDGLEAWASSLSFVANTYPETPEGKQAGEWLETTVVKMRKAEFLPSAEEEKTWKLVYPFKKAEVARLEGLESKIKQSLDDLGYPGVSYSIDLYDRDEVFLVVHGLGTQLRVLGYAELLEINKDYRVKEPFFVISRSNYQVLQSKKNLNEYFSRFRSLIPNLN